MATTFGAKLTNESGLATGGVTLNPTFRAAIETRGVKSRGNALNETCRNRCTSRGRRGIARIRAIALAGAILFVRLAAAEDWPYYQHDAAHTGNSNAVVNPQMLSRAWSAPSSPTGYSTPVIVGNSVYAMQNQQGFNSFQTKVSSFNLATGAINWSYTGSFPFPSQPGVGAGFVTFVGSVSSRASLYVLDAETGELLYTVPLPLDGTNALMPTIFRDPNSGNVTAFVAAAPQVSAVALGPRSGSVLWTQTGSFASSIPTVVGNSIVLTGTGQYYAFEQATGARNQFWSGAVSGGSGTTVAYDPTRQQFYVLTGYNGGVETLSAYHYADNFHITLLWQRTGAGVRRGSVAIGPTGKVYSAGNPVIWELDPATGATLRSIPGGFADSIAPALTKNVLWIFDELWTYAYDLTSLQLLHTFEGSRGFANSDYNSPGAFADGYFLLDYGPIVGGRGFDVYKAWPTPTPPPTPAPTATPTATATATPAATATPTASTTATPTPIPTATPSPTVTQTPTPTPSPSPSPTATPTATPPPTSAQALNISTRLRVGIGEQVLIGGFIITGTASKPVALRGIGPSLSGAGLSDVLIDPVLEVRDSDGALIRRNDNWKDDQRSLIEGTPFQPSDDRESVIMETLPPAAYTAILTGKNETIGVGLVEVYDMGEPGQAQLANISTRGFVRAGNHVMIGGFILGGPSASSRIALRGLGPSVSPYGFNLLADPVIELHDGNGALLITNDNWQDDPVSAAQLTASGLTPPDPKESAIFTTLPPGAYTAILAGKNGGIGLGLIEVYNLH